MWAHAGAVQGSWAAGSQQMACQSGAGSGSSAGGIPAVLRQARPCSLSSLPSAPLGPRGKALQASGAQSLHGGRAHAPMARHFWVTIALKAIACPCPHARWPGPPRPSSSDPALTTSHPPLLIPSRKLQDDKVRKLSKRELAIKLRSGAASKSA